MPPSRRLLVGLAGLTAAALLPLLPAAVAADPASPSADPLRSQQWALDVVRADDAWSTSTGRGVVVAVVDSGVDRSHPDLQGQLTRGATFAGCPTPGRSCGDGDWTGEPLPTNSFDLLASAAESARQIDNAHGTHVAGIIGARTHNGIGISGVAPDVRIMPVKVLTDGSADETVLASGIRWAARHGADVINLSLGVLPGGEITGPAEIRVIERAVRSAQRRGVLVVAAAGNTGPYPLCSPPASLPGVLCVTGVSSTELPMLPSQLGYSLGPDLQITGDTVAAPGGQISADAGLSCETTPLSDVLSTVPLAFSPICNAGTLYAPFAGTSMAAPHVAGVAALLLAQCRRPADVFDVIEQTARIPILDRHSSLFLPYYGQGIVDATAAVAAPGARC